MEYAFAASNSTVNNNQTQLCVAIVDGHHYNKHIEQIFGDCVYTWRDYLGFSIGWTSVFFWIACQLPQLIQNCKRKSVAAVSVWFLMQWFLGDIFNVVGTYLSGQLITEKAVAVLYVCLDVIISVQYYYFKCCGPNGSCNKPKETETLFLKDQLADDDSDDEKIQYRPPVLSPDESEDAETASGDASTPVHGVMLPVLIGVQLVVSFTAGIFLATNNGESSFSASQTAIPKARVWEMNQASGTHQRHLLAIYTNYGVEEESESSTSANLLLGDVMPKNMPWQWWLGWAIGWVSAAIYLSSRMPQVIKNVKRGSVEGLSSVMFMCTVMGNVTYGAGILLRIREISDIMKALPFLLGSLGTLFFDATILLQFWYYRKRKPKRRLHLTGKGDPNMVPRSLHGIVDWSLTPFIDGQSQFSPDKPPQTGQTGSNEDVTSTESGREARSMSV